MCNLIERVPGTSIDYIELVADRQLSSVERLEGTILVALAVKIGEIRLIDNAVIEV